MFGTRAYGSQTFKTGITQFNDESRIRFFFPGFKFIRFVTMPFRVSREQFPRSRAPTSLSPEQ